jgi:hypothetical protein
MFVKTSIGDKSIDWLKDRLGIQRIRGLEKTKVKGDNIEDGQISADKLESASNGQLLIGNGSGFSKSTITAGANVTITNTSGGITIASTGASGGVPGDGDYGDITVSSSGTVWTIDNDAVTLGKIQNITSDRLLGRDSSGSGDVEQLTVGGGLEFTGSGGIRRGALTGDVTASAGSGATTIASDSVTYAKMQDVSGTDKILGRSSSGSGDVEEITCTAAGRALLDDATVYDQRSTLGLVIGTNVQAYDATLQSLSALGTAADKLAYTTGVDTWAEASITQAGRNLLDDADATAQRSTLGLGSMATQNAGTVTISGGTIDSVVITGGSVSGITDLAISDGGTGASTASAARNNLLPSQSASVGEFLRTDGTNVSFQKVPLGDTTAVSGTLGVSNGGTGGTLPVANGGTGATTVANARVNLLPSYSSNASKALALNSSASDVEWVTATNIGTPNTFAKRSSTGGCQFNSNASSAALVAGNTSTGVGAEIYGGGNHHAWFGVNGVDDLIRISKSNFGIEWFKEGSALNGLLKPATQTDSRTWQLPDQSGVIALKDLPRGQLYFQGNSSTMSLSTTYAKISHSSTLDTSTSINFSSPANCRLRHTGDYSRVFNIIATCDVQNTTGSSIEVSAKLNKGGTLIDATQCNATVPHNGIGKLHIMWIIDIAPNDYVELFLASTSGTPTVTVVRMKMQATCLS